ncbi:MAG: hypothetical protein HY727_14830 [Candidatus Rokubacteria bacterium]|nr:hypothetical protein [Candidatus Rokubacteria bacterium]
MNRRRAIAGVAPLLLVIGYWCVAESQSQDRKTVEYQGAILRVIGVDRDTEWPREGTPFRRYKVSRAGWEFAIVRFTVERGPKGGRGECSEVIDVEGKSYKSFVTYVGWSDPGGTHECPFAVPKGTRLKSFRLSDAVFDIGD